MSEGPTPEVTFYNHGPTVTVALPTQLVSCAAENLVSTGGWNHKYQGDGASGRICLLLLLLVDGCLHLIEDSADVTKF